MEEFVETGLVGLAAIQTVFEGTDVNSFDRLRANQRQSGTLIGPPAVVANVPPCRHDRPSKFIDLRRMNWP